MQQDTINITSKNIFFLPNTTLVLSGRGWLLLLFISYLIIFPVLDESDIIAAMLSFLLLSILVLSAIFTTYLAFQLRRSFKPIIQVAEHLSATKAPQTLEIKLPIYNLPLLWRVSFQIAFLRKGAISTRHVMSGTCKLESSIRSRVKFPHRAIWRATNFDITVSDPFELTVIKWSRRISAKEGSIKVYPVNKTNTLLPIISSSARDGDLINDRQSHHGDPFDIKRYHPSDGMKRILWKVYARTGELVSRHQEPSLTPEGQVVIFVIADKDDDQLSASAIAYSNYLEEKELDIFLACSGLHSRMIAQSSQAARELLVDCVWDSKIDFKNISADIQNLITQHSSIAHNIRLQNMLVFFNSRLLDKQSGLENMLQVGNKLSNQQIRPIFCVYNQQSTEISDEEKLSFTDYLNFKRDSLKSGTENRAKFLEAAKRSAWGVIKCN